MKNIIMFTMASCPYCKEAHRWLGELMEENPLYSGIAIEYIDELVDPDIAAGYDYYYVPTFYVDGVKKHEGAATKAKVKAVLDAACE